MAGTDSIHILRINFPGNLKSVPAQSCSCIDKSLTVKREDLVGTGSAGLKEYFMLFLCGDKDDCSESYDNKKEWQDY